MPIGRKSNVEAPKIDAPPAITTYKFNSPLGDSYVTSRKKNTETSESILSPLAQATIQSSQAGLRDLAEEIRRPDAQRANDILQRGQNFYDIQANAINSQYDDLTSKAQSDISKRFGGAYNATFGTDYLGQLQKSRLSALSDSAKEATLFAEDLFKQDEDAKLRRFGVFNNYLLDEYNKAQGVSSYASNLLQNEGMRAQDVAIKRVQLLQQAQRYNQQAALERRQQNLDYLSDGMRAAAMAAGGG